MPQNDEDNVIDLRPKRAKKRDFSNEPKTNARRRPPKRKIPPGTPKCDASLGTAKLKSGKVVNQGNCLRPAGEGTDHEGWGRCFKHRGNEMAHVRRAAVMEARAMANSFGYEANIDPHDALRAELARTNGMVKWSQRMIQLIMASTDDAHPEALASNFKFLAFKEIFDEERDRLIRIARASLDSNLAERKQLLQEALATLVVDSFHAMIRQIPDLTPTQITAAQEVIRLELTERAGELTYSLPNDEE